MGPGSLPGTLPPFLGPRHQPMARGGCLRRDRPRSLQAEAGDTGSHTGPVCPPPLAAGTCRLGPVSQRIIRDGDYKVSFISQAVF